MKLKLTPLYILSFLALLFFVHEVHDWAHTLVARLVSGCWPPRAFDSWQFCVEAPVSSGKNAIATIAGPLVNFILLWSGWQMMDENNFSDQQSLGCSLVFASLPLNNLLGAFSGGGDLTNALRLGLSRINNRHHQVVTLLGLAIVLVVCVPPLIRAFICLPWWQGKFLYYPIFLIVPGILDRWFVGGMLNKWFIHSDTPAEKAYWYILGWTGLTLLILIFTHRRLTALINDDELPL
ncbi:MAG TPA: hypothetical protein VI233_03775 [Puia sp.]